MGPPSSTRIVAAAVTAMTAAVLPVHLTGALAPELQDELGFGDTGLGIAVAAFFAVSALLTTAGGSLSDRFGAVRAMRVAVVWSGVSLLLIAMLARSYVLLVLLLALATVGPAVSQPGSNVLVSEGVPLSRRGLGLGAKQGGIPAAGALAGLALPLVAVPLGWRWAFAFAAGVALLALLLLPELPVRPATVERRRLPAEDPRRRGLGLLTVGAGCGACAVAPISSFLVRSATHLGFSDASAGLILALGSVLLIAVRVTAGALADRHRFHPFLAVAVLLGLGVAGYALLASDHRVAFVAGAVVAFTAGWGWPGLFNLGVIAHFGDLPGAASGITQSGIFVGAVVGPLAFGALADHVSFTAAWSFSALWTAVGAVAILAARRSLVAAEAPQPTLA
jgi:MFS family permease